MRKQQLLLFTPVIFLLLALLDGQLSTLMKIWSDGVALASSHLLILALLFANQKLSMRYLLIVSAAIGLIMDSYYIGILGINLTVLPLIVYLSGSILDTIHENPITEYFSAVIFITGYEVAILAIQLIFKLAQFNFIDFIGSLLAPTLFLNSLFFIIFYRGYQFVFNAPAKRQRRIKS
ncbi:MAG: rod shape-determining protein MreD [Streptococcaceae bacterium]|jgi:rod shape-determining protein MreD|nr:rod shape-determining protein MreD [Streptococcaceae bacterium]